MNILDFLKSNNKYSKLINDVTTKGYKNIYIGNSASNLSKMVAALVFDAQKRTLIYITENIYEASKAYEQISDLLGPDNVDFFPVEEFISSELVASSSAFRLARMITIHNIIKNIPKIIVTNTEGITKQVMSRDRIISSILELKKGMTLERDTLVDDLFSRGYKKTAITEEVGTFSVRGSIVDIYPINADFPYRVNFFDNEIDTIKEINIETQMSEGKVDSFIVFPLYDIFYTKEELTKIENKILKSHPRNEKAQKDIEKLRNYEDLDQLYIYLPFIDPSFIPFINLIGKPICFYEDFTSIKDHEEASLVEIREYLKSIVYNGSNDLFISLNEVIGLAEQNIFLSNYLSSLNDIRLDKLIDLKTTNNFEYNNNIRSLIEDIKTNVNKTYIITHTDEKKLAFLIETFTANNVQFNLVKNNQIKKEEVNLVVSTSALGFIDLEEELEIITPNEFAPGKINKKSKYQKYYKNATKVYNKDDLSPGDYVVHQDYGIGIYKGIKTVELRGSKNDYLFIQYADEGKLYVPVENIYLIEKYAADSSRNPKLNRLDGKDWAKKKLKVKEKVMDVAKRLIKIQAERETLKGFSYGNDTTEQQAFEADFEYTETRDQINAIEDVKEDMESTKPLDRLVCGDVGFGKTEVAMRAAFKAVDNGKQVAYLAPTTVLTRQHFLNFKDRFEKYGVRVELLNRFVPIAKQKIILEGLKKGYVDIVIGTHRLLSKDIIFKDLGLLIVDEEQRFGVMHKERIKEMKACVDVLTLTATPIPRTLQMSLSGLKDLSLIETPPINRLPVQTYVIESNDSVVRDAINRELGRNGQVFYLLNRIEELDRVVAKVHRLVPKAKIGVIHGKMDKDEIEDQLVKFLDREFNVLVCTTIIETGIDIPNANTLIIEKADYLGLSQLYQIRGRVGRSDRISYAYLMYEPHKVLTQEATKRLDAIKEFTALGSGYKIAMRDLAIRGAGDILGDEQSGYIDAIGMDLYLKLLNESIRELKGIKEEKVEGQHYNINISRHIDTKYVSDDEIRIDMHKSISKIKSREEIEKLKVEYTNRYGPLSNEILTYMEEKYLEFLLKSKGVESFKESPEEIQLIFDSITTKKLDFSELGKIAKKEAPKFVFSLKYNCLYIYINPCDYKESYIYTLTKFLEKVKN